jgi:hypothetical protein
MELLNRDKYIQKNQKLLNLVNEAFPLKLSIYDIASVERLDLLSNTTNTLTPLNFSLDIKGDWEGKFFGSLIYPTPNSYGPQDLSKIQNFSIEVFNIIAGHTLTNIESDSELMLSLVCPNILNGENFYQLQSKMNYPYLFSTSYFVKYDKFEFSLIITTALKIKLLSSIQ